MEYFYNRHSRMVIVTYIISLEGVGVMAIDLSMLDGVIEKTLETVEQSKYQIFEIAEQAREECEHLRQEAEKVKQEVVVVIAKSDQLELDLRRARQRLSDVSKNFKLFTEEDIHQAYERANRIQLELSLSQEKEIQLRERRNDLQFRLRSIEQTVEKAENVMTQMGVVMGYLAGDLKQVGQIIEDVKHQQQMGLQVIQAQEEERKRVAREIHDGPAQSMANVVLRTELVEKVLVNDGVGQAREELKELKELVRESLADVRRIIFNLRPMALDDLGLVPTLRKYIEELNRKYDLVIDFKTFGKECRPPSSMEVALFRLVQESLTNVIKHAKAPEAQIKLEFQRDRIFLVIKDDGIGFDMKKKSREGFGILGMQERIKLLDGQMVLQSAPGQGTKLLLVIPIKQDQE
jgi:two-component system sensor histidine kinase DegS